MKNDVVEISMNNSYLHGQKTIMNAPTTPKTKPKPKTEPSPDTKPSPSRRKKPWKTPKIDPNTSPKPKN